MTIGVIMPARNAAETIAESLENLLAQEWTDWRAVIVDDGSTDTTRQIAEDFAARDGRIAVIEGPRRGAGAARNAGLATLTTNHVLFFDADDTLAPSMMRLMMERLSSKPGAEAVHCGWTYTDWWGAPLSTARCAERETDLFPIFARYCAFAIHACIVERSMVDRAGGFDETLLTSEDFDLWQRIARLGTRFVPLDAHLVGYRMREGLSWSDPERYLSDALRVVERGHAPDPRLNRLGLAEHHSDGMPVTQLPAARLSRVMWAASLMIASGKDPMPLLDHIDGHGHELTDAGEYADLIFRSIPMAVLVPLSEWRQLWQRVEPLLYPFIAALENRIGVPDFAQRLCAMLEIRIAGIGSLEAGADTPILVFGRTALIHVEVQGRADDLDLPGVDRAVCDIHNYGHFFGRIVLPVFNGRVARTVLSDAIAGRFAWPLLNSLFSGQIYPQVVGSGGRKRKARQAALFGNQAVPGESEISQLHDRIGWAVFAQELFGLPDWSIERLYDERVPHPGPVERLAGVAGPSVELSAELPSIRASEPIELAITIGGAPAMRLTLEPRKGIVEAARIRAVALDRGKMELARIAVREGIVEFAGSREMPLRERLHRRAQDASASPSATVLAGRRDDPVLAFLAGALARDLPAPGAMVMGAPPGAKPGDTIRRGELPHEIAAAIPTQLRPGQSAIRIREPSTRLFFVPDLTAGETDDGGQSAELDAARSGDTRGFSEFYGRHHFEQLFARDADPWKYTTPYEQTKYEQTLGMIPANNCGRVLEVGCAEGHFTVQLAPLVQHVRATDISDLAVERTARLCRGLSNIDYSRLDLLDDNIDGSFDAIVCSELLYYMGDLKHLRTAGVKMAHALAPDGCLVTAHANLVVDNPYETGFDWDMPFGAKTIGETFTTIPDWEFEHELATPLYRIQRFRKLRRPRFRPWLRRASPPKQRTLAQHSEPGPDVAAHILWGGGKVIVKERAAVTFRLPILMYHAVSETGPEALARWRVTPSMFEAQLRYLQEAGFRPATFEEWRHARETHTPLPGRRVMITFDDIYADFEHHALPLLQRYNFPASLFVSSDKIGGDADWDAWAGEPRPLIDLDGLKRVQDAGMQIGAHGASHRRLSGLPPAAIANELWRSRTMLEAALGTAVDTLAYPFGAFDESVERLAASTLFRHAVTTEDRASALDDRDLALARIEIRGEDDLHTFIGRLPE